MPPYLASTFDPIDRLPLTQQGLQVLQMFRAVGSDEDYVKASRRWQEVRGRLMQEEEKLQCSKSGAGRDRDIGIGILDDLAKAPVSILLPCAQLVLAFSAREKDGLYQSLNDAVDATKEKVFDEGAEKAGKKILARGDAAYQPLRDTLLRVLQQYSKRSRKHFNEILTGLEGIIKGVGAMAFTAVRVFLTPSYITPEWCGLARLIDQSQTEAYTRTTFSRINMPRT